MATRPKDFWKLNYRYLWLPSGLIMLTEETGSLCPSNMCVHTPAAFHTLKEDQNQEKKHQASLLWVYQELFDIHTRNPNVQKK